MTAPAPETTRESPEDEPGFQRWMPQFLEAFEECLDVTRSSQIAGVSRVTVWRHRRTCPWFAREYDAVLTDRVIAPLRASVYQRAIYGTQRKWGPEFETGLTKLVAERLLPELRANAPDDKAGQTGVLVVPGLMSDEEWRAFVEWRRERGTQGKAGGS